MSDYSLVPVDYQPDFGNVSLVPVDHDPFIEEGEAHEAQTPLGQAQQAQTATPEQVDQSQQPAPVVRLYVGRPPNNTETSESTQSNASTSQSPAPTSNAVTHQQVLQGAINQFYPGAEFTGLAQQAYRDGQYGNAIGYGVGALADSCWR
jgi:hypothetical protein